MVLLIDLLHNFLHFSHRNLSMRSFFLDAERGTLRLGGLEHCCPLPQGLHSASSLYPTSAPCSQRAITNLPPELLLLPSGVKYAPVSTKEDSWALGCIFFWMLSGCQPFCEKSKFAVLLRIFKTFGTPSSNFLDYQSLFERDLEGEGDQDCVVRLVTQLPQWPEMDLMELVFG